jgi:hypothetical protein
MIRIVLLGRSGNHLFQYAFGRVLAKRHQVPLVLDASWFNADGWQEVSHLLRLPLQAKVTRRASLAARALLKLTGKHYWEYRGLPLIQEPELDQAFHPELLDAPDDCVVRGYFQSYKYFRSIEDELRTELRGLLSEAVPVPPGMKEKLADPASVAVHVRRTDYLKHPDLMICGESYYRAAIARLRDEVPGAKFMIFSDDPSWCREVFRDADQEVAGIASANPLHDLWLMSLASHHIIANSTYSWWAAWIGDKPGQRVLMPDRWNAGPARVPIEDKKLDHWITIR